MSKYYDAVDGLRAVAVGLVLFFHAGFGFARGGFVGVDVFFVISGFLITGIIIRDIENVRWSFSRFYLRRIARLTPALLTTVIITLIAGYFILIPEDLARLGRSSLYASASVSNFFFWLEAGYFDQTASSKPLLHTWSLGVEEQFYLIWPAIIFLLARWRGKNGAAIGLAVMGVVSLVSAIVLNSAHSGAVFYLMPFRIYQFALGGLVVLLLTHRGGPTRAAGGASAIAILLAVAYFGSGESDRYWLNAIAPAVAAALFIWSAEARSVKAVFASPAMVWLGRRSYSIYLVHWPIMVLWPMATDYDLSGADGAIAIVLSIIAGALLHLTIEKPLRFKRETTEVQKGRALAATAALFAGGLLVSAHYWGLSGLPSRLPQEMQKYSSMKSQWAERLEAVRAGTCNITEEAPLSAYKMKQCASPPEGRRSFMIIGDSYAAGASIILPSAYPEIYFGQLTLPGCSLRAPSELINQPKRPWCLRFYKHAFNLTKQNGFDGVVFSGDWGGDMKTSVTLLNQWADKNNLEAVFLSDRPRFRERVPAIAAASLSLSQAQKRSNSFENSLYRVRAYAMEREFNNAVNVVNMHKIMCDEQCAIFDDKGSLLYLDGSHVSMEGADWFATRLRQLHPDLFSENLETN